MIQEQPYFFVSYSRRDSAIVQAVVALLEKKGIKVWTDINQLQPGMNWIETIVHSLENAAGLILFLSEASLQSEFVKHELDVILNRSARVIPILLENVALPANLAALQYLDLRDHSHGSIENAVEILARVLKNILETQPGTGTGLKAGEIVEVARETVDAAQGMPPPRISPSTPPDSIFIVHGHDIPFRDEVEIFLLSINVKPIVLAKMPNAGQMSIFTKFLQYGHLAQFAVVLFSSDDYGVLCDDYDDIHSGGKQTLQYRARQNVVLEIGFFYGKLGFDKVFGLFKDPPRRFPKFDMPSDLQGIPFETYDAAGLWKNTLRTKLRSHGFQI